MVDHSLLVYRGTKESKVFPHSFTQQGICELEKLPKPTFHHSTIFHAMIWLTYSHDKILLTHFLLDQTSI